ncbi:hypothetical protein OC25_16925 [Pedobacter kyungheensis]|uniref:Uncharacterized protein n=1 Tax=Pedobacter kyungheensis TaxID=1069985 RepID=A0A0C1FWV1_9SPHI|nr:hypothetical protein [Pedobacter kyungheensis]KIA92364.1 hypothetical protein OC25_16925 [Pedobacter kyungheensis]
MGTPPYTQKLHAEHNFQVCQELVSFGKAHDWVVTTAFYTALHFVQFEIFPFTKGERTYKNFDDYYNHHFVSKESKPSRHNATINLAYEKLGSEIGSRYKQLHDSCSKARYIQYRTNPLVAELSVTQLSEIKALLKK